MKMFLGILLFFTNCMLLADDMPEHAHPDMHGTGWDCDRGYYKSGQKCARVVVPENASINFLGNGWACNNGFKKNGASCRPMTQQELHKQEEIKRAMIFEAQRRKTQGVSGGHCETEYKTDAEVCIEITGGGLDCNENYSGNYYTDCDATLNYDIHTDYRGGAYLDVDVECRIEIEYKGRQTYSKQSDYSYQDESHNLYAHGSDSEAIIFNFSFSSYQEITNSKISNAECEIYSVDLY